MSDIIGVNLSDYIAFTGDTELLFFTSAIVLTERPGNTLECVKFVELLSLQFFCVTTNTQSTMLTSVTKCFTTTEEESTQNLREASVIRINRILIKLVLFLFQMARIKSLTISAAATNHWLPWCISVLRKLIIILPLMLKRKITSGLQQFFEPLCECLCFQFV